MLSKNFFITSWSQSVARFEATVARWCDNWTPLKRRLYK